MATIDGEPRLAGIEDFIDKARAGIGEAKSRAISREVRPLSNGQIILLEFEDGDANVIGDSVSLAEAEELAQALVQYGDKSMPTALLKLALAVVVLSKPVARAC